MSDWQNPGSYPPPDATEMHQWAWEFLRRNSQYRQLWNSSKSTGEKPGSDFLFDAFGVREFFDPEQDYDPSIHRKLSFQQFPPVKMFTWQDLSVLTREQALGRSLPQTLSEVVLTFDVRNDIESQLLEAKQSLEVYRLLLKANVGDKSFSPRGIHENKFPLYLQLLDAESQLSPSSDLQIIRQVKRFLRKGEISEDLDEESFVKRLKQNLTKAREMRDAGYRTLSLEKNRDNFFHREEMKGLRSAQKRRRNKNTP
jgi:hypothetical protein